MKSFYKPLFMSLVLVASTSSFALAADAPAKKGKPAVEAVDEEGPGPEDFHRPCEKLQLSDEQKAQLREHMFKFENERIDLEAKVEHARLNYKKLATDPKADYKDAMSASEAVSAAISKKISAEETAKTEVLFKIFKPEQREDAFKCEMFMHHHEGMEHGPRGFHKKMNKGPGPDSRE